MPFSAHRASFSLVPGPRPAVGLGLALVLATGGAWAQTPAPSGEAPAAAPAGLPPPPSDAAVPSPEPTPTPAPTTGVPTAAAPTPPATPGATAAAAGRPAVPVATPAGQGVRVSAMLRAQIRLDRAHFSPGEIDGRVGFNSTQALAGFQKLAGLPPTGRPDVATIKALEERDSAPLLVLYTLTEADLAGPFEPIPASMAGKAKLSTLGYASPTEALAERFHVSPGLLQAMNPGRKMAVGTALTVPNVEIAPLPQVAKVVVSRAAKTLTAFDAAGHEVGQFPVSSGSTHDPLPIGNWKVNGVARNPTYHYNPKLFWDANKSDTKETVPAGPNNPVGVVWIDLSKEHYGIHGTPEPTHIGKTESHGCIRMTNWDVSLLAGAVRPGTVADLVP